MKTPLFSTCTLLILSIFCFQLAAQDNAQIGLPEGAIARIGKGTLGEIHFSPDGSKLAVSTSIGIWFHDPQTGKALELLGRSHITPPYAFAFSPDGKTIASGSWGKRLQTNEHSRFTVEVWDTTTGKDKAILVGHTMRVNSIAYAPSGKVIATGGWHHDNTVRLWDARTGKNISTSSKMRARQVAFVVFSSDGKTYVTAGDDNMVHLWDGKTGKHKITLAGHTKYPFFAAYSPDSKTIATGSYDGTIRLWDTITGDHNITLSTEETVICLTYSPDGNMIASGSRNGNVQLWDTRTMKLKSTLTGHTNRVKSIAYSPDGNTIATASSDNTVRLWDSDTGKTKAILTGYIEINSAAYSPDGNMIVTGSRDGTVLMWDAQTAEIKTTFSPHNYGRTSRVAYSPDGNTIAVARPYDSVYLLDAQTGKHKDTLKHSGLIDTIINVIQDREYDITSLVYSPDGKTIVTGLDCYTHEKGTLYLWNAKTGKRKRVIFKGKGCVRSAVFSDDGTRIIATGDWKKKTRVWNAKTGKELTPTAADIPSGSKRILHSPDGTTTAHVERNGTVLIREGM